MKRSEPGRATEKVREAIHDRLGPKLFAAATKLSFLRAELSGEAARRAGEILELVQETREEARRIVQGNRGRARIDLRKALAKVAGEHGGTFADFSNGGKLPAAARADLLGIAREAAHNAVKHGQARKVKIRLHPGLLEVEDDGVGPGPQARVGFGMGAMKRRARRLGGVLTLQRVAPGRTILACQFTGFGK